MKNSVRTCFIKVSSFSILFVIAMLFWTVAYASETGISIQEPNISIADGNFVFEVYAYGYQNSNYSAEAIVATYDEDGNLLSARRKNLNTLGEACITLPVAKNESYYKIMLFDLEEELTPLCKALKNNINYLDYTKGYILEAKLNDVPFSNDFWQVKLLTGDGIVIYDVTRDITEEFTGFLASCFNEEKQEYSYDDYEFSLNRLISFDTNSDGELTEYKQTYDNFVPISGAYDADSNKIGNTILNENLIIYDVSKKEVNDTRIINVDSLKDEVIYSGMVFCNSLGICETMVITNVSYQLSESSGFGIVKRIAVTKNSQGYDVIEITYIQDESEKVAIFDDNSSHLGELRFVNASVGDVLVIFSEENETVDTYGFLGKVNNGLFEFNRSLMGDAVTNKDTEYVYGYITNENKIKVSKGEIITLNRIYDVLITDESNKYTYNDSGRVVNIETGDFTADYYDSDTNQASAVFLKVVNGVAKDVYSFNKRVTVPDGYDESIELYDKINYILAEVDGVYATGEFNFPEKTETIIPKLKEAMNEISFWWNENIIVSVNLIRSTYSDLINEIRTTLNSLTTEEKNEFTTELNTKLSASCLKRIAEIFDINASWN